MTQVWRYFENKLTFDHSVEVYDSNDEDGFEFKQRRVENPKNIS